MYYKKNDDKTAFAFKIIAGKYHGKIICGEIMESQKIAAEKMGIHKEGLYIIANDKNEVFELRGIKNHHLFSY